MYLFVKWMENDLLAMKKFFPWLKTHFLSILQANMYFFSLGQNFCVDKKYFARPDEWGIIS